MVIRIDRGPLQRPTRRGNTLVVEGYAARVHGPGDPLRYSHGDEYRDAAELARIVEQLPGKPVVLQHPAGLIKNGAAAQVVGRIDAAWLDGEKAAVRISVTDAGAARAIEDGTKELSLGYATRVDAAGFQRDTDVDHTAIVSAARCGATCSLRTDEKLDCPATCACQIDRSDRRPESSGMPPDPTLTPEQQIAALKMQLAGAEKLAAERKDALDAATTERDTAQGKVKTLEGDVAKYQAQIAAGATAMETEAIKTHSERADKAETKLAEHEANREADITKAAEIRIKAQVVMGPTYRLDGSNNVSVQTAVIKKLDPKEDLAGKSAAYIGARFDSLVDSYMANARSLTRAGEELVVTKRETRVDSKEARQQAWREQATNPKAYQAAFGHKEG